MKEYLQTIGIISKDQISQSIPLDRIHQISPQPSLSTSFSIEESILQDEYDLFNVQISQIYYLDFGL